VARFFGFASEWQKLKNVILTLEQSEGEESRFDKLPMQHTPKPKTFA